MNTIFISEGSRAVYLDEKKNFAKAMDTSSHGIDWMYLCPEDCEIRYKDKSGNLVVKQAAKGDIIIQFYGSEKNLVAVVKNKEFKENVLKREADKAAKRAIDEVYASNLCGDCDCKCAC